MLRIHNSIRMKRMFLGVVILAVIAALVGFAWINHGVDGKAPAGSPTSTGAPGANVASGNPAPNIPSMPPPSPLISHDEMRRLRAALDAALQANPDLVAEQQKINGEMQAQLAKLDAAAIKADPKVAPVLAKLAALHHLGRPHAFPSAPAAR